MRCRVAVVACTLALVVAGCGGDAEPAATAPADDGRRVILASGCLACHQIGSEGNSGPGNNLSGIGGRRSAAQIRGALLNATAPMPSYRSLPRTQLDDLVAYLSGLRGDAAGGAPCPDGADCG